MWLLLLCVECSNYLVFYFATVVSVMWSAISHREWRSHIRKKRPSKPSAYCLQSNNALSARAFHTLWRMLRKYSRSFPNRIAIWSYSWRFLAINSGHPSVFNCDAATLFDEIIQIFDKSINIIILWKKSHALLHRNIIRTVKQVFLPAM